MINILNQRKKEIEIIINKITEQNKNYDIQLSKINQLLSDLQKQNNLQNQKYLEKSRNASLPYQQKLDDVNEYNKNIYTLEFKKYINMTNEIKNQIKRNELYLARINYFIEYLESIIKKDIIAYTNARYKLLNALQTELFHVIKAEKEIYNDKIDLNNDYITFIKICTVKNQNIDNLVLKTMNKEENIQTKEKSEQIKYKESEYKEMFKTKKFEIKEETLNDNLLLNFNIEDVINILYSNEKTK